MAELLGVQGRYRSQFKHWSDKRARVLEPTITPPEIQEANRATHEMDNYFRGVIEERRQSPREDLEERRGGPPGGLIRTLGAGQGGGGKLNSDELVGVVRLVVIAGQETNSH